MKYLDETPKYYIYAHAKPNGEIFYIGKGSGDRLQTTGNRSDFWKRTVKKHGFKAIKLVENLTEPEAFEKEIELIAEYKAKGLCKVNISLGGDGVKVEKRWWNDAISKSLTGIKRGNGKENPSYKNVITKEQLLDLYEVQQLSTVEIAKHFGVSYGTIWARLKEFHIPIRRAGQTKVKIRCLNDNKIFDSISEAAKHYGLYRENIRKVLHGKYKHTGDKQFTYE